MILKLTMTTPSDVEIIKIREDGAYSDQNEKSFIASLLNAPKTYCYTISDTYGPIAIMMGLTVKTGVIEICGLVAEDVKKYPREFIRICRNLIRVATDVLRIHRIQCTCRSDFPVAAKFIEFFGFEREGVLRKACADKKDLFIYGRCP